MIHFETACERDAAKLTEIQIRSFHSCKAEGIPPQSGPRGYDSVEWQIDMMKNGEYIKILEDGFIIGGLVLTPEEPDHCHVERVFLDPEFHGMGIGRRAFAWLEQTFPQYQRWTLRTPELHLQNRRLYEGLGYVKVGDREIFPGFLMIDYEKQIDSAAKPVHVAKAGQGEHLLVGSDVVSIKAGGQDTSGQILALEVRVPGNGGPPNLHRHASAEVFYILDGEFEIRSIGTGNAQQTVRLQTGDTAAIPSWAWHNFRNVRNTTGRLLAIHSPVGIEEFAREIGTPIEDPLQPPMQSKPTDEQRQRLMNAIERYMEILPA